MQSRAAQQNVSTGNSPHLAARSRRHVRFTCPRTRFVISRTLSRSFVARAAAHGCLTSTRKPAESARGAPLAGSEKHARFQVCSPNKRHVATYPIVRESAPVLHESRRVRGLARFLVRSSCNSGRPLRGARSTQVRLGRRNEIDRLARLWKETESCGPTTRELRVAVALTMSKG